MIFPRDSHTTTDVKLEMIPGVAEMELHMMNMIYAALPMHAQTEKTTFSCKDNFTLTKHTWHWTYSVLLYFFKPSLKQEIQTLV